MKPLSQFKQNKSSYNGENGIIAEIFNRIGTTNKVCVEFGARDGVAASNTLPLIKEEGWTALLIEGDKYEFSMLKRNFEGNPKVKVLEKFVGVSGEDSLDSILARNDYPKDIDFVCIDIDSFDYQILEGLNKFQPRVICIEYSEFYPKDVDFVQPIGTNMTLGTSLAAIDRLARSKGYVLVYAIDSNAFLIREEIFKSKNLQIYQEDIVRESLGQNSGIFYISNNGSIVLKPNDLAFFNERFYSRSDKNMFYIVDSKNEVNFKYSKISDSVTRMVKNFVKNSLLGNLIFPYYMKLRQLKVK